MDETVDSETAITLGLLNAVERGEPLTQRTLANELGIALGLANSYLKRCVRKGLIKVNQIPPNRYAYYLTPHGFAEKARLTGEYLSGSFTFYRRARAQCAETMAQAQARGYRTIALAGLSELAEIAILCQSDAKVSVVGIVEPSVRPRHFAGVQVAPDAAGLPKHDALLVTDIKRAQQVYDRLVARYGAERVFAPALLHVNPNPRPAASPAPLPSGREARSE
ncbi:MAG: winged helix-turn-helix transcriptional regulator [Marivibrio sp.]